MLCVPWLFSAEGLRRLNICRAVHTVPQSRASSGVGPSHVQEEDLVCSRFHHLLTVASLRRNHDFITSLVEQNPVLAPLCYIGVLVAVIGITCPGATMLSFLGGILFKQPYASIYAYCGYIVGATISYFVTTFVLGDYMRKRLAANSQLYQKFEANVRRNAFAYLVAARYTMVFPFFFVNGAAALVGVRCRTFIAATSVSCIPGSVIYTTAGGALANLLHKMTDDEELDKTQLIWAALSDPNVKICMAGVTCALIVVAIIQLTQSDTEKSKGE
ncbi:stas [Symbiodinium natans]|uniref:Stas protein n=1 Tax=Symbiodinium natans TaxID=878477 RepID=A0A812KCD7_9DINO|nr:stas [Symbiodinium natans]